MAFNVSRFHRGIKPIKKGSPSMDNAMEHAKDSAANRRARRRSGFRSMGRQDVFSTYGGKISKKRLNRRVDKMPLNRFQREYVKQVMAKHDRYGSRGITRKEFLHGLEEMESNVRDPIKKEHIRRIKKHF